MDDPLFRFVFPDARDRQVPLPWLMRMRVTYGCRVGHVDTTASDMLGHAVWLPPGQTDVALDRLIDAGSVEPERHIGPEPLARFNGFMTQIGPTDERLMPDAHWFLMILGVDPAHQRVGVGTALIHRRLARADAAGHCCYLETAKERNVAFYERHGFEVVEEADIAGGGPHVWMMARGAHSRALAA